MNRVIIITMTDSESGGHSIEVRENGQTTGQLAWDEMLGQVAAMTHPDLNKGRYPMRTEEEWNRMDEARMERLGKLR